MGALPAVGSTIAGYRLDAVLGRGGMGVVFRAQQPELGRQVAIKVIAPELARDDAFRERFKRESRLAAAIEHPNAIPIYEAGTTGDGTLYLVMRYVEGTDLHALIHQGGGLDPARVARLVEQVAGALDEAHALGLVHRDVKPANVLVASRRGHEQAFLTDFGLTKPAMSTSGVTGTGQWMGTLDYVPPEQVEGRPLDARADVYALGCVLFEALTGRVPFDKPSDVAKLYAHANEAPPRPSDHVAGFHPQVDRVVARAMAKQPAARYPSAGDFGRAAGAAVRGEAPTIAERIVATGEAAPVGAVAARAETRQPGAAEAETRPLAPAQPSPGVEAPGPPEAPTRALPREAHEARPPRRRGWVVLLGGLVTLAAAGAVAILLAGGEGGGGQAGSGAEARAGGEGASEASEFTTLETPEFTVDVPEGWRMIAIDEQADDPDDLVFRTELLSPDEDMRLLIARRPDQAGLSPAQQAELAEVMLGAHPSYVPRRSEPVMVAGRESHLAVFTADDTVLGPATTTAYFLASDDAGYRVQGISRLGANLEDETAAVARRVAETLDPG